MIQDMVYEVALEFRNGIVNANLNGEFKGDRFIESFPKGNCGIASNLLGRYLLERYGIRSWYTSGEIKNDSHVWLTLEDHYIVDITGDQYKNRLGVMFYDKPIYVGKMDMFHKRFKLNSKPVEITPNDWTPDWLGEDDLQLKNRKAYEIILKYVS